jgi:oligo-1,6-glucosidase
MTNAHLTSFDGYRDIETLNYLAHARAFRRDDELVAAFAAMSRDNARTPVQWDGSPHAGFTTGTPWLPVNPNHVEVNAAAERADPRSVFHHYRRLIALRHDEPAVALGDFTMLLPDDEHVYAFTRRLGDVELLVLGNFTGDEQLALVDPVWTDAEVVLGNYADERVVETPVVLRAWEALVVRRTL